MIGQVFMLKYAILVLEYQKNNLSISLLEHMIHLAVILRLKGL